MGNCLIFLFSISSFLVNNVSFEINQSFNHSIIHPLNFLPLRRNLNRDFVWKTVFVNSSE